MKILASNKARAAIIGLIAFGYYTVLSAKTYTWLFASGDSGDWLAASNWWIVPQPFGSPLYISLGHMVNLLPGSLPTNMTIILSCIPAAITVSLVYLIVKHITKRELIAIASSAVLLGAGVFLTQATILEEYAIATMFVTGAFYFYLKDNKWLVAVFLGLGSAVHIMVVPIAVLWLLIHTREIRSWVKVIPVYVVCGLLPYGLILALMVGDNPQLLAGGLSWGAINSYLGSTVVVGSLSIVEAPSRILHLGMFLVMSFGLAILPASVSISKPMSNILKMTLVVVGFSIWYYLTCLDPTTWTFLVFGMPFVAVLAGMGLQKLKPIHTKIVLIGALLFVVWNGVSLNANQLHKENPVAVEYYEAVQEIPDGSAVVIHRGGWEALGLFYAMSEGKDIAPVFFIYSDNEDDILYQNYLVWASEEYDLIGNNTQETTANLLEEGKEVYVLYPMIDAWKPAFEVEEGYYNYGEYFRKVEGVNLDVKVYSDSE